MAPLLGVSGAMATYQRVCSLLRTLRQPATTCEFSGISKNLYQTEACRVVSFSSLRKTSVPSLRLPTGATVPCVSVWPRGVVPRTLWGHGDLYLSPLQGTRSLHLSTRPGQKDIPDYLLGSISQVDTAESDLLGDDFAGEDEEETKDMENDVIEFLTPRLIPYEETDTSFVVACPSCDCVAKEKDDAKVQEIFIDKKSGYFVCPGCCKDGPFEQLCALLNTHEDLLTPADLSSYLSTATLPLPLMTDDLLKDSPLKGVSKATLERFGARVTLDESRLVLPVRDTCGHLVGIESVSLLHYFPQIIRRYVVGRSCAFAPPAPTPTPSPASAPTPSTSRKGGRVVLVPTCCDVLVLAQLKIHAVSLPLEETLAIEAYLLECVPTEVVLWYRGLPPPRHLLLTLIRTGLSCCLVETSERDTPIYLKSASEVKAALQRTLPVLSPATTTFTHLKDKVYYRLTHKEETSGVQWRRFEGLNDLLLGHRPAEVTVLTGPTGCGKTTLMAEYSLDLCMQGVCTLWGSFEVSMVRLCEILLQQYSGAALPQERHAFNTLAAQFSTLPLHFLTYHGQQSVAEVVKAMQEAVQVWGVQHTIIDNLQFMLGCGTNHTDRWREQDEAVAMLRRFATLTGCHVTLIAHPKKLPEGQPLGISSVFGSAKVTQEADNVLILQVSPGSSPTSQSRKVLQVVKNRYGGQLGDLPLRFHKESLTLSSCFRQKVKEKSGQEKDSSLRRLKVLGLCD